MNNVQPFYQLVYGVISQTIHGVSSSRITDRKFNGSLCVNCIEHGQQLLPQFIPHVTQFGRFAFLLQLNLSTDRQHHMQFNVC